MSSTQGGTFSIGVDIGGTFTDAIVIDGSGTITIGKAPSTPPAFERGFIDALESVARRMGLEVPDLVGRSEGIFHGCTVGTNALVEGRTARVGLLTTHGMQDAIFVMQGGGRHWGMPPERIAHPASHSKPTPLVPKHLVEQIDERITFDGNVVVELNEDRARAAIQRLLDAGVEAFGISLMWAVVNPVHEQRLAELVREAAPNAFVSVGSDVVARTGEYQRTVATVINAAIGPPMRAYLERLDAELSELGYARPLYVMSCTGGVLESRLARQLPLLTIGSGPVGGLIGAGRLARLDTVDAGHAPDVITTDMGGTTFDVGVIRDGAPLVRKTTRHDQYEYFLPTLDVRSIGAGGGSIIRFDAQSRTLRVGPESAGAVPGPAAYRRGGTQATVTDADIMLGYLNPDYFLGGELSLSVDAAREALTRAGEPLGFGAEETAAAAARIVDNQMADAIRLASVQQGYDPREHVLYAYGGAGPVHATALARELGISKVVVPLSDLASGWSAFGVVSADAVAVDEMPQMLPYPFDPDTLNDAWEQLEERVLSVMASQGIAAEALQLERSADLRYTAQVNDVRVACPASRFDAVVVDELVSSFESEYARLFGADSGYPDAGYLLTSLTVRARAPRTEVELAGRADGPGSGTIEPRTRRGVIFYEHGLERHETPVYDGREFRAGMAIDGPAIIEYVDTTVVLRDGQRATVDSKGSVVVAV